MARLSVFFETQKVETAKRMIVYTYGDYLAICGGLLGLFLGFSALSVFELFYYFTLRLFWRIYRLRTQNDATASH